MNIDIPAGVVFLDADTLDSWGEPRKLCFRHAVIAAMAGRRIKTELVESKTPYCSECSGL